MEEEEEEGEEEMLLDGRDEPVSCRVSRRTGEKGLSKCIVVGGRDGRGSAAAKKNDRTKQ